MKQVLADCSASIAELKNSPTDLIKKANGSAISILNNNKLIAYLVPAETYESLIDELDDHELAKTIKDRRAELSTAVEVNIDDL